MKRKIISFSLPLFSRPFLLSCLLSSRPWLPFYLLFSRPSLLFARPSFLPFLPFWKHRQQQRLRSRKRKRRRSSVTAVCSCFESSLLELIVMNETGRHDQPARITLLAAPI